MRVDRMNDLLFFGASFALIFISYYFFFMRGEQKIPVEREGLNPSVVVSYGVTICFSR